MKRLLSTIAALACACAAFAYSPEIRDIDVNVCLYPDGSAVIRECWDVTAAGITEWYLVKDNLGDIEISNFTVFVDGQELYNEGRWNVDRSREQKAGRCGIVKKNNGVELCWGCGEYGPHKYEARYTMSNVVKSLDDYDCLHMQFISPGLSQSPGHVKVTVEAKGTPLSSENSRMWGFGYADYRGLTGYQDGKAVFEASEEISYYNSVISLMRFDKGIFTPTSVRGGSFDDVLTNALEGADFGEEEGQGPSKWEYFLEILISFFFVILMPMILITRMASAGNSKKISKLEKRRILGVWPKDVDWNRNIPFDGDLDASYYTLENLGEVQKDNSLASALILRMIYKGYLNVSKDEKENIEISFNDSKDRSGLSTSAQLLYDMMKEASGDDRILQHNEFKKWANGHKSSIRIWANDSKTNAVQTLRSNNWKSGTRWTEAGKAKARETYGFKKFLSDFTNMKDKTSIEVNMWQEYMVYGALFGIADKVAKELKEINPQVFDHVLVYDYGTMRNVINMTDMLSRSITNARYVKPTYSTGPHTTGGWGGFGGGSSIGGGGGFSGGGFGGGGR
ncbi:MAG: DUF2207 domain-containing protein [Bacteroidales bacterium]|nr:DUF2207 domain-containing protein [Bacteroidales bacterium]